VLGVFEVVYGCETPLFVMHSTTWARYKLGAQQKDTLQATATAVQGICPVYLDKTSYRCNTHRHRDALVLCCCRW
jgi:hypothetical protein